MNEIIELIHTKQYSHLKEILSEMEPFDIAALYDELPEQHMPLLYRLLPKETAAEVFVELDSDSQEMLIKGFSDNELKEVLDELYLDDAVDIIEEMPANVVKRILRHTDIEMRSQINNLLNYPKDSAGSIMTIEFVDLKEDMTVQDAFTRIRRTGLDKETIYTCYVTDKNRILLGIVTAKELLLAEEDCIISDIMETNPIYVNTSCDKEEVALQLSKYDFLALPVVDNENRLVGIVTVDDAIDVIQDEATEDIEKMAGIMPSEKPYLKTSIVDIFKQRIPWLLLLMVSASFTQAVISHFTDALDKLSVLTLFIPMLMGTGGNSGSQASVTVIRGLSLDEIEFKDIFKIIWKECGVAILCGVTLAIATFLKLLIFDHVSITIAIVVCAAMASTVFFSKLVGCTLPLMAKKIGFDPAVMASPLITTIVDAMSLVIYFNIATAVLSF
ncbi:MAG: magnesium transporter [Ruminococcaceae bacterium]|nr:magnesium transporter [Oscillospiraceae bacterium]